MAEPKMPEHPHLGIADLNEAAGEPSPPGGAEPPTPEHDESLGTMRHSAAHIMAEAVLSLFPDAKIGIGPVIENGFYYDFLLPRALTPDDLAAVEARMREIIAADAPFVRTEVDKEMAKKLLADQPFKVELITEIPDEQVRIYEQHGFADLCRGPHVPSTGKVGAFKLLNVAGAYWRGDERRPMLQRIYGTAWYTQEELDQHLAWLEEAQRRDHRRLGRDLELFFFDPIAPGSPFFLPKGATVYNLMVGFMRELYVKYGYQEVITPQLFSADLWKRSGHYENYRENMYFVESEDREFGLKPMNCPGHCVVFVSRLHSYRELPLRMADFGRLHRYERSGVLSGLTRVRSFSQDDAHIFCRPDQVQEEISALIRMMRETYAAFHLGAPRFTLSLRPEKRVGTDAAWDWAEDTLRQALRGEGIVFEEVPGEGAFYGPKIDTFVKDALGREWQLNTIQLDPNLPERFDLEYVTEDGRHERPLMIHRAVLGSIERFFGVLLEHHAGAFPVWLAPVQAVVIPIADRHTAYAEQVAVELRAAELRVTVDARSERMQAKIRDAQLQKIPYMLVVGDKEQEAGTVTVRHRSGEQQPGTPLGAFKEMAQEAVRERQ
ncbi:MAG: threonine--tRNA ligase [Chloroflexi bacterium]|nr:threonine--tRNA ligase [Chloroflexota bacterium]